MKYRHLFMVPCATDIPGNVFSALFLEAEVETEDVVQVLAGFLIKIQKVILYIHLA